MKKDFKAKDIDEIIQESMGMRPDEEEGLNDSHDDSQGDTPDSSDISDDDNLAMDADVAHEEGDDSTTEADENSSEKKDPKDLKIEELTDSLKRNLAEFDNFRKRTDKEKSAMFDMGAKHVLEKLLPIIDNFERGLGSESEEEDSFASGMRMIYKQLEKQIEELGVSYIDCKGQPFDPNFHNAVMHIEDESLGENIVAEELQKGYMYKDGVLRHSMVKVAN